MAGLLEDFKKWLNLQIQISSKWQASPYLPSVTKCNWVWWSTRATVVLLLLAYFFYRSWIAIVCLLPIEFFLIYYQWKNWRQRKLLQMEVGFRDWLYYVKEGISSGKSFEQALIQCRKPYIEVLGTKHPFLPGMLQIYRSLELHIPIEDSMRRLACETEISIVKDFAVIFQIIRKQGGHMAATLERTIQQIYTQIELRQEIQAVMQAKKTEHYIMCIMPFGILCFVGKVSADYFSPLYHNLQGVIIMTFCMLVYLFGVYWGVKLTEVSI